MDGLYSYFIYYNDYHNNKTCDRLKTYLWLNIIWHRFQQPRNTKLLWMDKMNNNIILIRILIELTEKIINLQLCKSELQTWWTTTRLPKEAHK